MLRNVTDVFTYLSYSRYRLHYFSTTQNELSIIVLIRISAKKLCELVQLPVNRVKADITTDGCNSSFQPTAIRYSERTHTENQFVSARRNSFFRASQALVLLLLVLARWRRWRMWVQCANCNRIAWGERVESYHPTSIATPNQASLCWHPVGAVTRRRS